MHLQRISYVACYSQVAGLAQNLSHARDGGLLLAHAHVDAEAGLGGQQLVDGQVLLIKVLLPAQLLVQEGLVDDGVDGDGRLARLTVADDQLTLAQTCGWRYERNIERDDVQPTAYVYAWL